MIEDWSINVSIILKYPHFDGIYWQTYRETDTHTDRHISDIRRDQVVFDLQSLKITYSYLNARNSVWKMKTNLRNLLTCNLPKMNK